MIPTKLKFILKDYIYSFLYYLPLEGTDKIVFCINDPSFIKHTVEHALEHTPDIIKKDEDYFEMLDIANKMTEDNNPVLFIYEFKD